MKTNISGGFQISISVPLTKNFSFCAVFVPQPYKATPTKRHSELKALHFRFGLFIKHRTNPVVTNTLIREKHY